MWFKSSGSSNRNRPETTVLALQVHISIPVTQWRSPDAHLWEMKWNPAWCFMIILVLKSYMNRLPTFGFIWMPVSYSGFNWKQGSICFDNTGFKVYWEVETGNGFPCRCLCLVLSLFGNRRSVLVFLGFRFPHLLGCDLRYFLDANFQITNVWKPLTTNLCTHVFLETEVRKNCTPVPKYF